VAFGPSCEFAPLCPARITFHSRRLSRGSASPQHMRRVRSPTRSGRRAEALRPQLDDVIASSSALGVCAPLRRFAPERASRREAKPSAALTRFSLRSLPSSGSVPVSRPLPSCGSLVAFHAPAAGPLQGLVPRMKFREVLDRPVGAPLGLPFKACFAALAHGFVSRAILLHASRAATLRPSAPSALESCATANSANRFRPPAFLGFSTSGLAT